VIPAAVSDASALASLVQANVAHLQTYLPKVTGLATVDACERHLQHVLDCGRENEVFEWHIVDNGALCGAVRLNHIEEENHKASIAYYLGANHQGKGLATAAVSAVLGYCFSHMGMNRIELKCASENLGSQQVAKRLGFMWEGMLRQAELLNGGYVDLFVYGLLREEFKAKGIATDHTA
jgi:ribosomal-protein-serine acetyltransferase